MIAASLCFKTHFDVLFFLKNEKFYKNIALIQAAELKEIQRRSYQIFVEEIIILTILQSVSLAFKNLFPFDI